MSGLRLDVSSALKNPGQEYAFEGSPCVPDMEVLKDPVRFSDVRARGTFSGAGEKVALQAEVTAHVDSRCALCLSPAAIDVSAHIEAICEREPKEEDRFPLVGHEVDFDPIATEALLLELPFRFLCKEDCKGLCPQCGANLNHADCGCPRFDRENPFQALRALMDDDEEV